MSNGRMDQDVTWYEGRLRHRPHCVRWEPSFPSPKPGHSRPLFGPCILYSNEARIRNPLKFAGVSQTGKPISAANWLKFTTLLFGPLCENVTSSTKSEVYIASRQRKTEPQPQATCTENFSKFEHVVLRYASGQTRRQTYRQTR